MQTGPVKIRENWYNFDNSGALSRPVFIRVDKDHFYSLKANGELNRNTWSSADNKTFYFNSEGVAQTG